MLLLLLWRSIILGVFRSRPDPKILDFASGPDPWTLHVDHIWIYYHWAFVLPDLLDETVFQAGKLLLTNYRTLACPLDCHN